MEIKKLIRIAGRDAKEKGWWDNPPTFGEFIALCHSELSEALEEHRSGHTLTETYLNGEKPEGIPVELADVVIRIFDYCDNMGIDLEKAIVEKMLYNRKRPYRHGNKVL